MFSMASRISGLLSWQAPSWLRRDHPIVARELNALPLFLGRAEESPGFLVIMALVGAGMAGCSCGCGGILLPLLLIPLGWLPLLWAVPVINREVQAHTWDTLRVTPYSVREIVLAKMSAVLYRMTPLLAFMLVGQVISTLSAMIFWWMLSGNALILAISINGQAAEPSFSRPGGFPGGSDVLVVTALLLLLVLLHTLLDFLVSIVLGGLASALTDNRNLAYLAAFGLRLLASVLLVVSGVLLIGLMNPADGLALAAAGVLLLLAEGGILWGTVQLTVWRAERL